MKDYVTTSQDNGGVHVNSGIVNHAFYVMAIEIGGYAWEKAGQIWYKTLTDKLSSNSNFQNAADLTFQTAADIFGTGSLEQMAVEAVGLKSASLSQIQHAPDPTPGGEGCLKGLMRSLGLVAK